MWRQGQTHHPYTLSFLGTWGHGDTSLGYIDVETGTDTPPLYTLIFGDVGTRGQLPRIYTYGDRDIQYHPIHSHLCWHGDSTLGYIHMSIGADHTTHIHPDLIYIVVYKHVHVETGCIYRKAIISCSLT